MRIVVNGCFDLFHEGHKYILSKALEWAKDGYILVLINTDESIKQIKGSDRPIQNLNTRVDAIREFVFEFIHTNSPPPKCFGFQTFDSEITLAQRINEFGPDIILKGNDRTDVREIVGSDKWPVCILPRLPGYSTTEIIKNEKEK